MFPEVTRRFPVQVQAKTLQSDGYKQGYHQLQGPKDHVYRFLKRLRGKNTTLSGV